MIDRLAKVEQRLDSVLPTLSTKADVEGVRTYVEGVRTDVHKGQSEMKTWLIATVFALLVGIFTIGSFMSFKLNALIRDAQSTAMGQSAGPVIIKVPTGSTVEHHPAGVVAGAGRSPAPATKD
jgi:hypothetical protein